METWKIIIICLSCILIAAGISAAVVIFTNKKSSDDDTTSEGTISGGTTVPGEFVMLTLPNKRTLHGFKLTREEGRSDWAPKEFYLYARESSSHPWVELFNIETSSPIDGFTGGGDTNGTIFNSSTHSFSNLTTEYITFALVITKTVNSYGMCLVEFQLLCSSSTGSSVTVIEPSERLTSKFQNGYTVDSSIEKSSAYYSWKVFNGVLSDGAIPTLDKWMTKNTYTGSNYSYGGIDNLGITHPMQPSLDQSLTVKYDVKNYSYNHGNYYQHYKVTSLDNVADRKGFTYQDDNDPEITVWVDDTIEFIKNTSHPMRILEDGGQGRTGENQDSYYLDDGSETLDPEWLRFKPTIAGTYYYQCVHHSNMHGKITVDPKNTTYIS